MKNYITMAVVKVHKYTLHEFYYTMYSVQYIEINAGTVLFGEASIFLSIHDISLQFLNNGQ